MKLWKKAGLFLAVAALLLSVRVFPAFAAVSDTGYSDVDADIWYAEAVAYCRENNMMDGVGHDRFDPEGSLTRAALATVLYRIAGTPVVTGEDTFTDTDDGKWYSSAVLWASQENLIGGYGNGLFGTNDPVSRQDMTTILWRYAGSPAAGETMNFSDASEVSSYAAAAVDWASANNIVSAASNGTFAPRSNATRAQIAAALMNYTRSANAEQPAPTPEPAPEPAASPRILIAYFSRYGNTDYTANVDATTSASVVVQDGERQGTTERVARMIAEQTGGDLHLIETVDAYPTDFNDVVDQNHQEISAGTRPALSSSIAADPYDTIFIGYPVWASSAPTPVLSFLESCDLSGKTVIPFCTHDGYGAGSSYTAVSRASTGAVVEQGLALEASSVGTAEKAVTDWLSSLNLSKQQEQASETETAIRITIGGTQLDAVLYDSGMARQFIAQLPQTITMSNYGGREVYGGIDQAIQVEGAGQLRFDDGDITYCPRNNTAAIFYAQSSRPNLTMEVYPIGRVLSDLSIFPDLPSSVDISFEIVPLP